MLEGIDTAFALEGIAGNAKLYRKLLHSFLKNESDSLERFKAAWLSGDTALASRHMHTLKSVAGAIGAIELQRAAGGLEEACRDGGGGVEECMRVLVKRLAVVLASLRTYCAAADHQ